MYFRVKNILNRNYYNTPKHPLNCYFILFSVRFDVLIYTKINKKYYFNIFSSEKHVEPQLLPHF